MKRQYIFLIVALTVLTASCKKFLDVQPKGTLTEDVQFNDVQGFRDAIYGVYASMASADMYGKTLSLGFLDKIGQMFIKDADVLDRDIASLNYTNKDIRTTIDNIWGKYYTAISYVNNIIKHTEATPLQHADIKWIKGEAYALRAFLHYDVVRLFADNYKINPAAKGIPYAYYFDLNLKTLYSLEDTYKNILADLNTAEKWLDDDNAISFDASSISSDYRIGRYVHCNKYAVRAIKARVFYSMGNNDSAAFYAKQVIDTKTNFALQEPKNFASVKRFPAPKELIFGLNNTQLTQTVYDMFLGTAGGSNNLTGRRDAIALYETSTFTVTNTDVRYTGYYKYESQFHWFIRFVETEADGIKNPITGINMIRLPEMFYIYAESVYDKDKTSAADYLNQVRASRGRTAIAADKIDTKEKFENEMLKERMREMPGEGQIFFALKHYNRPFTKIDGKTVVQPSAAVFVLPWPQTELDLGNK